MRSITNSGARIAPLIYPEVLRAADITARTNVSAALAATLAELAFGPERRDHVALLGYLMADRVGTLSEVAR